MKLSVLRLTGLCLGGLLATGCTHSPSVASAPGGPEKLVIHPDGSMVFRDRPISGNDVVIYRDGYGGEKAAVRIRMEPLHPDFFRDTIIVERKVLQEDNTVTQN